MVAKATPSVAESRAKASLKGIISIFSRGAKSTSDPRRNRIVHEEVKLPR